jgi:hypothetical protein
MNLQTFFKTFLAAIVVGAVSSPSFGNLKHDLIVVGTSIAVSVAHAFFPGIPLPFKPSPTSPTSPTN